MAKPRKQKQQESGETTARKIWLAGLGAYGKSLEGAHDQLDKASQDASRFFHDLVDKGQEIEGQGRDAIKGRISEARERISGVRERIGEAADSNTRSVEDMIGRVRQRLGFGDDPVPERIDALTRQVNSLARAVSSLTGRKHPAKKAADQADKRTPRASGSTDPAASKAGAPAVPGKAGSGPAASKTVSRKARSAVASKAVAGRKVVKRSVSPGKLRPGKPRAR